MACACIAVFVYIMYVFVYARAWERSVRRNAVRPAGGEISDPAVHAIPTVVSELLLHLSLKNNKYIHHTSIHSNHLFTRIIYYLVGIAKTLLSNNVILLDDIIGWLETHFKLSVKF